MNFLKDYAQQQVRLITENYSLIIKQIKDADFKSLSFELQNEIDDNDVITDISNINIDNEKHFANTWEMDEDDPILKLIDLITVLYSDQHDLNITIKINKEDFMKEYTELFT